MSRAEWEARSVARRAGYTTWGAYLSERRAFERRAYDRQQRDGSNVGKDEGNK